jgi:hypothetical protein
MRQGLVTVLLYGVSSFALADMPIVYVSETSLPYELSPSSFDNSPSNFDNSLSNFDNSGSNFDNSPSNFDNSPSNFENGLNGDHRLYYKADGLHMTWAGYYVRKNNHINFFSPGRDRIFYKPADHAAVFSGEDGSFCGVVAKRDGTISLALTSHGTEVFKKLNAQ